LCSLTGFVPRVRHYVSLRRIHPTYSRRHALNSHSDHYFDGLYPEQASVQANTPDTERPRSAYTRAHRRGARDDTEGGESLSSYENSLRQARAEGYSLLEQQQSEANGERQRKVVEVRREIEAQLGQEKDEIQSQAERARVTLLGEAERVAAEIKKQVLRR